MDPNQQQNQNNPGQQAAVNYAGAQVDAAAQNPQAQQPSFQIPQQPGATTPSPNQPQPGVTDAQKNVNPNSTQNSLLIAEIRDGIAIMNDGSFRAVIATKSINFDLMSPEEREAVEYSFQGFLNSLYFPIQIYVRSERVDLRPYVEKLDKLRTEQSNMLLSMMMEDYIQFISVLAEETNIMDKQFYVVIPHYLGANTQAAIDQGKKMFDNLINKKANDKQENKIVINEADLNKAKTELKNKMQHVMSSLAQVGVQSVALDTRELGELFYNTYNPDTATRQHFTSVEDYNAPVITKGVGDASTPHLDKDYGL